MAVKRASCQMEVDLHVHAGWHDNVVNLRGLAYHGGHTYLVMEMCPRGTLDLLIHAQGSNVSKMDPSKLLRIIRSIARGMLHLHTRSPPIFHRDLKPANIFIGHGYVMKIGDFGMARYGCDTTAYRAAMAPRPPPFTFDEAAMKAVPRSSCLVAGPTLMRTLTPGVIGTAAYSAPELLNPDTPPRTHCNDVSNCSGGANKHGRSCEGGEFDSDQLLKADVYAFGVLLWELMERQRPHAGMDGFQVQTQWVLDPWSMVLSPPKVPDGLAPQQRQVMEVLSDLVGQCTAWDPKARPSFKSILSILREASRQDPEQQQHGQQLASPFS